MKTKRVEECILKTVLGRPRAYYMIITSRAALGSCVLFDTKACMIQRFLRLKICPRRFLPPKCTEFEFNTRIIPRKRCLWFSNGGRRRESGLVFLQE